MSNKKMQIMGILNTTPDSFFDGGKYTLIPQALKRAEEILIEGADIIDIGGESTRPGANTAELATEIERTIPVIKEIKKAFPQAKISIDTYNYQTALQALDCGAEIINDISGLKDERLALLSAKYKAKLVINHIKGTPQTMMRLCQYEDILKEVYDFLKEKTQQALDLSVDKKNIIIDLGLGFSKTTEQNWHLLENTSYFKGLDYPILIGASRKSFTNKSLELSLKCARIAFKQGAEYLRVHDVKDTVLTLEELYAK